MGKHYKRDKFFYKTIGVLGGWAVMLSVGFKPIKSNAALNDGPYLIVSNHSTDVDPIMLGKTIGKHMYFVASEHIFTKGFLTKILKFFFNPIPIRKGGSDLASVLDIKRRLKDGNNVALFPEAGRNYSGQTEELKQATGKLIKSFGTSLITFKFKGGYLASPRWSDNKKKGKYTGEIVNVYSAKQLSEMTPEQINKIIETDITQNDFDYQEENNLVFKGKKRAESIEKAFFVCPKCGRFMTVASKKNTVFCTSCDFTAEYGEDGHLHGENLPFTRLDKWNSYQQEAIEKFIADPSSDFSVLCDDNLFLAQTLEAGKRKRFGRCTIALDREGLTLTLNNPLNIEARTEPRIFPLDQIAGMSQCGKNILVFSSRGERFELKAPKGQDICLRKYIEIYNILKRKDN